MGSVVNAYGALAVLLALLLVPGLGASFALYRPGELELPSRLALAFALGYGVSALTSYVLALAGAFYAVPAFTLVGASAAACWAVAWRRARRLGRLRRPRLDLKRNPTTLVGLVLMAALAAVHHDRLAAFVARIPFRYWVDGMQIAHAHEIPGESIEYGDLHSTVSSKVLLSAFNALGSEAIPSAQVAVGALLWIVIVASAIALWALAREAGLKTTAPLIPVLAMANPLGISLTQDLDALRAEVLARMVAFTALTFGVRALLRGGRRDALVGGAVLAISAGTHLVPTVFACLLLAGFAVAGVLARRSAAGFLTVARPIGALAVGALVGYGLILVAPGSTGFGGATASSGYVGYPRGFDPTAYLANVASRPASGEWYRTPGQVVGAFVAQAFGDGDLKRAGRLWLVVIAVGALAAALYVLVRVASDLRYVPLACWTAAALSILIALYFSRRYEVYTLGTFGMRRFFDYSTLLVLLAGAATLELGLGALRRLRAWVPLAAGLAITIVLAAAALAGQATRPTLDESRALPLLSWIRVNTECDGRLVANARTVGVFHALTGRTSVTEGMGPFLRPEMLREIVSLLMETEQFFRDPAGERDFLARRDIDYVIALHDPVTPGSPLGFGRRLGPADAEALSDAPNLELIHEAPDYSVYQVLGEPAGRITLPERFPCLTTPLE